MSYHVTILRTHGGRPQALTSDEVAKAVASMDGRLAFDAEQAQVFEPAKGQQSELMFFEDGELWAGNPSEEFLRLMIGLATLLGARVRGDELETYRSSSETYYHPDDRELVAEAQARSRKVIAAQRRRDWLALVLPFSIFALIAWLYVVLKK